MSVDKEETFEADSTSSSFDFGVSGFIPSMEVPAMEMPSMGMPSPFSQNDDQTTEEVENPPKSKNTRANAKEKAKKNFKPTTGQGGIRSNIFLC